ncbi:hypothetical protein R1sor_016606 [Riccia sorocarpa]|uniref:DNA damage-inducible protein 1 n=1 Tax=Riccia sorocarpa TaxID=122646 RepID=A0ABD3HIS9_9MARC
MAVGGDGGNRKYKSHRPEWSMQPSKEVLINNPKEKEIHLVKEQQVTSCPTPKSPVRQEVRPHLLSIWWKGGRADSSNREEDVENLKAILEVETGIPLAQQQILYHGKEIKNNGRLNSAGVVENDLLMLVNTSASAPSGPEQSQAPQGANMLALNSDGSAANPSAFLNNLRANPNVMTQLMQKQPDLGNAIIRGDIETMQNFLRSQHRQQLELRRQQQREIELMNADPFDVEAQRKIEEAIRQKNVDENWEAAVEYNPESFARVSMLYVDMEVNGIPLKTFRLLRLLDRRYGGIARGVGQSEIVGRIHVAPLKIGKNYYPCTFNVLDQPDLEFIFGLDMLRKHQCSIDLKDNVLRVGGGEIAVPFLAEKDIPAHFLGEERVAPSPKASGSGTAVVTDNPPTALQSTSGAGGPSEQSLAQEAKKRARSPQDLEVKITRLMELGFDRESVTQALTLCDGNEEQAASYLFGG